MWQVCEIVVVELASFINLLYKLFGVSVSALSPLPPAPLVASSFARCFSPPLFAASSLSPSFFKPEECSTRGQVWSHRSVQICTHRRLQLQPKTSRSDAVVESFTEGTLKCQLFP